MKKTALCLALCLCALVLFGCHDSEGKSGQYLYTTALKYSGEDDPKAYLEIAGRSKELLALLEEKADVFVMNAYNFQNGDGEGTPLYEMNQMDLPIEIDPAGDSLIIDDRTQNILVPEKYRDREQDILREYRAAFYFEKVTAENSYNEDAGLPERLGLTEEDLTVNIIYVKDGQSYPVYREDIVCENGCITDPVVQVYTGNIHCNYAHSDLSQWTCFFSDKEDPGEAYETIRPYIEQCGAGESLQSVKRVG